MEPSQYPLYTVLHYSTLYRGSCYLHFVKMALCAKHVRRTREPDARWRRGQCAQKLLRIILVITCFEYVLPTKIERTSVKTREYFWRKSWSFIQPPITSSQDIEFSYMRHQCWIKIGCPVQITWCSSCNISPCRSGRPFPLGVHTVPNEPHVCPQTPNVSGP
jgi:hypothetical protein